MTAADSESVLDAAAQQLLFELDCQPTLLNIQRAFKRLEELKDAVGRVNLRIACVSSFMFDPLQPALALQAIRSGMSAEIYVAPYGQYEQELINPDSGLARFKPDVVLFAVRLQDTCPQLYEKFNTISGEQVTVAIDDWHGRLDDLISVFRSHSTAHLLLHNHELPAYPAQGIADTNATHSQARLIRDANDQLFELAGQHENVKVMDCDSLVARHGRTQWSDPRLSLVGRIPVAQRHYWPLAGFYISHIRPLYGLSRKVLVLDADNTLWGGVLGDVGIDGISLGEDFPGNAFVAFQKRILELYNRGVVLCLASKNDPGSVEQVLENHRAMILRPDHFAAMSVNWQPKPENIKAMAAELNLGLDSFVFMDDHPVECELMRHSLPEVLSICLPKDPSLFAGLVESLDVFDQWAISREDRQRGQLYKAEVQRKQLQTTLTDMPSFYRSLQMRMTLYIDHAKHVGRAAQLTNRTNQFNMHTVRCSEDDIRQVMADDQRKIITLDLQDRFGDNGVIGLAIVSTDIKIWILDQFLMSCRVLGRTVEHTFIRWIAQQAQSSGAEILRGLFQPTAKNQSFASFYGDLGFNKYDSVQDGIEVWDWPLDQAELTLPQWFEVNVASKIESTS